MSAVRLFGAALGVAAVLGAAGCARAVDGTAVAAPGAVGSVATTCRQYVAMNDVDRREVITAIGADGNQIVAASPELWIGVAAALCAFVDPGAPVRDVVTGGMR